MSTGFSGNLGFSMPANWAFDQFYTTSIGSGSGHLEIDKDGFSGKDHGVSFLDEVSDSTANTPVVEPPESTSDMTYLITNLAHHPIPLCIVLN